MAPVPNGSGGTVTVRQYLRYKAGDGAGGLDWNNWEAVFKQGTMHYAVKETQNTSSVQLHKDIVCPNQPTVNHQGWTYTLLGTLNEDTTPPWPVPFPGGCP